jgi:predicted transposase/invertase (TIGR01784 family)
VELQLKKSRYFTGRILYYACKLFTEQLRRGIHWEKLNQVISIVICNHRLFPGEDYLNAYEILNTKTRRQFTNLIKLITIELPKVPPEDSGETVWPWLAFLKSKSMEEAEVLAAGHKEVSMALSVLRHFNVIQEIRWLLEEREYARMDQAAVEEELRLEAEEARQETAAHKQEIAAYQEEIAAYKQEAAASKEETAAYKQRLEALERENQALKAKQ